MSSVDNEHLPEPLKDLLRSNYPVEEGQAEMVTKYVAQREVALEQHRVEVADIVKQVKALNEKQQQLMTLIARDEEDISACKRRLSLSISTFPTEILQIIFRHSTFGGAGSACRLHASVYHIQPPFSLIQVSKRWREVALGLPSLWTSFSLRSFEISKIHIPNFAAFQVMVKNHYKRSGNLPKSLDFYLESDFSRPFASLSNPASAVLNEHIKITHLALGSANLGELLHALGRDPSSGTWPPKLLQNVESLVLSSDTPGQGSQGRIEIFSRKRLKALRRLTLHTGRLLTERIWLTYYIPWKNLTHVAVTSWIQHSEWLEFFPKFTGLRQGIFYIKHDSSPDNAISPAYQFPHLLDLTLIFQNQDMTTIAFEPYKLPSLQHLRLGAYTQPWNFKAFDLLNLQPSLANLTSLSLCHLSWEAPMQTVSEILVMTVNLKSLTLGLSTNYDQLLEQFQVDWNGFALLPNLETFTIDCLPSSYNDAVLPPPTLLVLTADGFTNMVKDRWRPIDTISQLKEVALYLSRGHERLLSSIESNLKKEVREGLVVRVGAADRSTAWVDPLERRVTHWDDGLVLPENGADCARCWKDGSESVGQLQAVSALWGNWKR